MGKFLGNLGWNLSRLDIGFLDKPGTSMDLLRSTLGVCHENRIGYMYIYMYVYIYIYMYIYIYISNPMVSIMLCHGSSPHEHCHEKNPKLAEETGLEASTLTLEIC